MKYRRIFFYRKKLSHLDTSRITHPVQIISLKIHDHQKFTFVFLRFFKFCPHKHIFFRCLPALTCAFNRSCIYMPLLHFKETFRRCTYDLKISIVKITTKRRRIIFPKIIKHIQRYFVTFHSELLCHIDNVDISLYNIADHTIYCLLVFVLRKIRQHLDRIFCI